MRGAGESRPPKGLLPAGPEALHLVREGLDQARVLSLRRGEGGRRQKGQEEKGKDPAH